jgi:hypothetical protein
MSVDIDADGNTRMGRSLRRGKTGSKSPKKSSKSPVEVMLGDSHHEGGSKEKRVRGASKERSPSIEWDKAGYEARRAELRETLTYEEYKEFYGMFKD